MSDSGFKFTVTTLEIRKARRIRRFTDFLWNLVTRIGAKARNQRISLQRTSYKVESGDYSVVAEQEIRIPLPPE